MSPSPNKLFVNIGRYEDETALIPYLTAFLCFKGCNKGYNVAAFLGLWAPHLGLHSGKDWQAKLIEVLVSKGFPEDSCGYCRQCEEKYYTPHPEVAFKTNEVPRIFCIDAVPVTASVLNETVEKLGLAEHVTVVHAAFGRPADARADPGSRTISFPNCSAGNEICAFDYTTEDAKGVMVDVKLWAVDDWLEKMEVDGIIPRGQQLDMLHIDVEGHDPSVIEGAQNAFKNEGYRRWSFSTISVGCGRR